MRAWLVAPTLRSRRALLCRVGLHDAEHYHSGGDAVARCSRHACQWVRLLP